MPSGTRGGRLWQGCLAAGFCLALISAAAAQDRASSAKEPSAPSLEVEVARGLLTLRTDGAPLAEVLRAIGQAGGFEVALRGGFAAPVRESFADRPLEDALRRLLAGHSVVIVREAPARRSGAAALARIAVTENRGAVNAASAQPTAWGAAEARRPDDADDDVAMRRAPAVPKIGSLEPREVIETASRAFANADATARSRAVAALNWLDGPDARRLLRERVLGDEEPRLRMQALRTLASSRGERAINVVARALRDDLEPRVRMSAVRALGQIGGDRARRTLERAARDLDPEIGLAAERALAQWPERPD